MATQDWPTDRAFMGATFTLGADVPKSVFRGFYTGNRETLSHLGDRLNCIVTLPPCKSKADAARREAFCMGLVSTGDWVRFGMPHRPRPQGTMAGSPTVNGAVLAGARSLTLSSVKSGPNLLLSSGFETDSNTDGLADSWSAYQNGTTGSITRSLVVGDVANYGALAQRVTGAAMGTGVFDQIGVAQNIEPIIAGLPYSLAFSHKVSAACSVIAYVAWYAPGAVFVGDSGLSAAGSVGSWSRHLASFTAPAGATNAIVFAWAHSKAVAGSLTFDLDNIQFEQSTEATSYAPLASCVGGDFIGIGGNLLQVAHAGAFANDSGAMTVPLVYPAPKAITSGAAVTLAAPTGTWELDTDGLQLDYTAGVIQQGIALPFRQVPV